jgi:hypothetical protein
VPHSVEIDDLEIGIGKEGELEPQRAGELPILLDRINADAEQLGVLAADVLDA